MQIGNKLFPYPTINNIGLRNCFKETTYSFRCNDYSDGQNYVLENACVEINNENIKKLINEGYLGVGLIIECSSTVYRKMFEGEILILESGEENLFFVSPYVNGNFIKTI